jgi:acyl-CoA synthetase (AMP-forming)/AMP-acid ligase II
LNLGLKKGDRVALFAGNGHQLVEAAYACYKAGFAEVPLNARISIPELVHMLNNSGAAVLIFDDSFAQAIEKVRSDIRTVKYYICISNTSGSDYDFETFLQSGSPEEPSADVALDDLASLNYTSGTSGKLKAAMLSHRNRIQQAKKHLLMSGIDIDQESVMCHVAPVTHAGSGMLLPMIWRGGRNHILTKFDVKILLETIEKERVTHLLLVPTMLNFIMNHPDIHNYDLSSIRTILYAASPMPVQRIKQAIEIFGPVLIQSYGLTETSATVTNLSKEDHIVDDNDAKRLKRLASAGVPSIECEVRIVDIEGRDVKPGEVGQIIERGDDTMMGYWNDPELTAHALRDGWVYTNDMATVDEDGYIYIVDRKFDMIISGGFNIYPSEVESVLFEHPAVFEAVVIGVPDEQWGESVKAVVVLREGAEATEEELIEHCKERIAGYKKPKSVEFAAEIPKNPNGKILRRKVREKYWTGSERRVH